MLPNAQFPADLVTFTEEILNGKLNFLCSVAEININQKYQMRHNTNTIFKLPN